MANGWARRGAARNASHWRRKEERKWNKRRAFCLEKRKGRGKEERAMEMSYEHMDKLKLSAMCEWSGVENKTGDEKRRDGESSERESARIG